jgi:hypothetical protein
MRYLVKNLVAAASGANQLETCLFQTGLDAVLESAARATPVFHGWLGGLVVTPPAVSLSSSAVGVDRMRTQDKTGQWETGAGASNQTNVVLADAAEFADSPGAKLTLATNQSVALVSPLLLLEPGRSPSSLLGPGVSHEFLHFHMVLQPSTTLGDSMVSDADETDFAAVVAVSVTPSGANGFTQWHIFSVPTVASIRHFAHDTWSAKLQLRLNCFNILEEATCSPQSIRTGVVCPRPAGLRIILLKLRGGS